MHPRFPNTTNTAWYVHQVKGEEIPSIAGRYTILEEGIISFEGKQILYVMGGAMADTSCCGSGGCHFVRIPGYLLSWKSRKNKKGYYMSKVIPVTDEGEQQKIRAYVKERFPHAHTLF